MLKKMDENQGQKKLKICSLCGAAEQAPQPGWPAPLPHLTVRSGEVCWPCGRIVKSKIEVLEAFRQVTR